MARSPAESQNGQPALTSQGAGRWALSGDLLFGNVAQLLDEGLAAFGTERQVEINLAAVGRVDSAGLALLVEWSVAARGDGRTVHYRDAPLVLGALAGVSELTQFLDAS